MDFGIILRTLGLIILAEALVLILPLGVSLHYGESTASAFYITIVVATLLGLAAFGTNTKKGVIKCREGFMIVTLGWVIASIIGAIPFYASGTFNSFIDAVFETVSGFTTTGASVMSDIEIHPRGIIFWRSLTHWLGGMGILVFALAILPLFGMGSIQLFKAESPGPNPGKLVPKVGGTAKRLYGIYLAFTIAEIILLKIGGMSWFDSANHTFATMGTGGFSTRNASIGAYPSPYIQWIIVIFMFLAGTNFGLYYEMFRGKAKALVKDPEFRFYCSVIAVSVILITLNIRHLYAGQAAKLIRDAAFQVVTIITTTGFCSLDYEVWPEFSKMILFVLMFIGGCAGSTGGALKCVRVLLLLKFAKRELLKLIHPKAVMPLRLADVTIPRDVMRNISGLFILYIIIFVTVSLTLLTQKMDLLSSTSATIATLGNVGPGFGMVGPAMNYSALTDLSKLLLSVCMILGRLEVYTVLVLFIPSFWKN